ncbi:DUF998 domain-containing protein [Nonomuraea sp. NPDC002799]
MRRCVRTQVLARISGVALAVAAVLVVAGHFEADDNLSAFGSTISDFAASDRGGAVETGMFVAGVASLILLVVLRATRAPLTRTTIALLLLWSVGVIASAVIPTNPAGMDLTTTGYVHRYVSFAAFAVLPVAGLILARHLSRQPSWRGVAAPVRGLAIVVLAAGAAMLFAAFPGHRVLIGLAERLLVLAAIGMLGVLNVRAHRLARG